MSTEADVTLILEGTYPYVSGGVSAWVHQILNAYPDRRFALHHIGAFPGAYGKAIYKVPANVTRLEEVFCSEGAHAPKPRPEPVRRRRAPSRVLAAIRRLHLEDQVDEQLVADLSSGDLTIGELLHGDASFEVLRELYQARSPGSPFMDFFWHFRAMHVPLLRLLERPCPRASLYHAVSTGYAGVVGAVASYREKRPLVVTEHGLYAREREMELSRAAWIKDGDGRSTHVAAPSPLRRMWSHYFRMMSKVAYHQATRLLTLSEVNRAKQLADGADPAKTSVVPNGVDAAAWHSAAASATITPRSSSKLRVGFVGRVVPIKDVITLIRAVSIARETIDMELWMVGPETEDPVYARRCHALVSMLGLEEHITFMGSQPVAQIYPQLDALVLTSLSEGQPLVILEAYAAGVPVIATDVGACRELVEGGNDADRDLGASGIATRVANPADTAAAMVRLAVDPELRRAMGRAGAARLAARYQLNQVVASYESLYESMVTS